MKNIELMNKTDVFFRSFLIQAFWNFERIQNLGFAYCIYPFLVMLYPDREQRKKALLRHLDFFCTHPYLVNVVLGLIVSMEERLARHEEGLTERHISQVKMHITGPLAALGDSFFWHTWRSFCAIVAASLYFFAANRTDSAPAFLALFLFLTIYNMLHIPVRWFGFTFAYRQGMQIIATIERFRVFNWEKLIFAPASTIMLVLMLVSYLIVIEGSVGYKIVLGSLFFLLYVIRYYVRSHITMFFITVLISVLVSFIASFFKVLI
ncbi:MAG: hypothetical protein GF384_02250 [Elusimicrobia bacterium]|nr:hypothetical protein [Elusimicrobiota bacterium]MBD3411799.1 hypothetical protein [Elusimicrobiota bacterium]